MYMTAILIQEIYDEGEAESFPSSIPPPLTHDDGQEIYDGLGDEEAHQGEIYNEGEGEQIILASVG